MPDGKRNLAQPPESRSLLRTEAPGNPGKEIPRETTLARPRVLVGCKTAFQAIAAPLDRREGFRHLWLGDSGQGKTYANKAFVSWLLATRKIDLMLSVDDKNRWHAQFFGAYRANPEHLAKQPLTSRDNLRNHVVFRGVAYDGSLESTVKVDEVSRMAWELVRLKPARVCLNIDELSDATNGYQNWQGDYTAQVYRKGRGVGLSIIAGTQLPQSLPREAFGLSETIAIFRLEARELAYLRKHNVIGGEVENVIPRLKVGEWVLYSKGRGGWNGQIYKV